MRLLEFAWGLLGLAAAAMVAGWWRDAFVWAAVAMAGLGLLAMAAGVFLARWDEATKERWVARVESLEARVEALQKQNALRALG